MSTFLLFRRRGDSSQSNSVALEVLKENYVDCPLDPSKTKAPKEPESGNLAVLIHDSRQTA
jgi:hypothetical protein